MKKERAKGLGLYWAMILAGLAIYGGSKLNMNGPETLGNDGRNAAKPISRRMNLDPEARLAEALFVKQSAETYRDVWEKASPLYRQSLNELSSIVRDCQPSEYTRAAQDEIDQFRMNTIFMDGGVNEGDIIPFGNDALRVSQIVPGKSGESIRERRDYTAQVDFYRNERIVDYHPLLPGRTSKGMNLTWISYRGEDLVPGGK